jgi:hypothetical protein
MHTLPHRTRAHFERRCNELHESDVGQLTSATHDEDVLRGRSCSVQVPRAGLSVGTLVHDAISPQL